MFCYHFLSLFSLCCSDWIISIVLLIFWLSSLILSSIFFILLLRLLHWFKNFTYRIFISKIFVWFFYSFSYTLYFFAETYYFYICFKHVHNCLLKHFYGDCFKIFIRQFQNLCHIGIGVCCFSYSSSDFPGSRFVKDFFGHSEYYTMRLWISIKSSVLKGLSDTALVAKGRCHLVTAR